jgi:hypothetical protein
VAAQLPTSRVDRTSPVPFYFQLKKLLAEEIVAGRWLPGDRLPSEPSIFPGRRSARPSASWRPRA